MSSAGGFHDGSGGTLANCVALLRSLCKTMEVCGKKFMFVSLELFVDRYKKEYSSGTKALITV